MSISSPPNYGSPDWQRGYYSAQKLLATVPVNTSQVTVNVPPNAETIVVLIPSPNSSNDKVSCTGVTSGMFYPVVAGTVTSPLTTLVYYIDVTDVIDAQVTINRLGAPNSKWYAYADAGVHVVADPTKATNEYGSQYVVPIAPSTLAGDHPPNELKQVSIANTANATVVLAAPGAGSRYRIFYATLAGSGGAGSWSNFVDSVSLIAFINATGTGGVVTAVDYKPSGLPLSNNAAITVNSTAGVMWGNIVYTQEAI